MSLGRFRCLAHIVTVLKVFPKIRWVVFLGGVGVCGCFQIGKRRRWWCLVSLVPWFLVYRRRKHCGQSRQYRPFKFSAKPFVGLVIGVIPHRQRVTVADVANRYQRPFEYFALVRGAINRERPRFPVFVCVPYVHYGIIGVGSVSEVEAVPSVGSPGSCSARSFARCLALRIAAICSGVNNGP